MGTPPETDMPRVDMGYNNDRRCVLQNIYSDCRRCAKNCKHLQTGNITQCRKYRRLYSVYLLVPSDQVALDPCPAAYLPLELYDARCTTKARAVDECYCQSKHTFVTAISCNGCGVARRLVRMHRVVTEIFLFFNDRSLSSSEKIVLKLFGGCRICCCFLVGHSCHVF